LTVLSGRHAVEDMCVRPSALESCAGEQTRGREEHAKSGLQGHEADESL